MNFKQLHHLIALADEGRFVAAAERVHLSQPAFSRSIRALEEHFGFQIFDRGQNGVTLTPVGRTLVDRVRGLVYESRCLERDAELLRKGEFGELNFGAGPTPSAVLIPHLLMALRKRAPQLVVGVRSSNVEGLLNLLKDDKIDFFMADPRLLTSDAQLVIVPVMDVRFFPYVRTDHPLVRTGASQPSDMAKFGIGAVSLKPTLRNVVAKSQGFARGSALPLVLECDDSNTLAQVAQDSDLIVYLPEMFAKAYSGLTRLPLKFTKDAVVGSVHAISLRGRTLSPAAKLALAECTSLAKKLGRN